MTRRLLLVEDEAAFAIGMIDRLKSEGYEVEWEQSGPVGFARALSGSFDLIMLDVGLPGKNGFDICRDLRHERVQSPVMMLTARGEVMDRVLGLKLGADDYVQKNSEPMELMARIEALIRRSGLSQTDLGSVKIDLERHEATRDGRPLTLSPVEFRLLEYLIERRGVIATREELLKNVWGLHEDTLSRTVDVHVAALRKKIETDPRYPKLLLTVKGIGYKLEDRSSGVRSEK